MSDLLERIRNRRAERIKIATEPTTPCPAGQHWEQDLDPILDELTWRCVPDYTPPPPTGLEPCPPGEHRDEWGSCVPDTPTPIDILTPVSPQISENLSHINVQNIFRLKVQMGNEYGATAGWGRVLFPQEMLSAHVVAVSGPRSAKVSRATLVETRRANYKARLDTAIDVLVENAMDDPGVAGFVIILSLLVDLLAIPSNILTAIAELLGLPAAEAIDTRTAIRELFRGMFKEFAITLWDYAIVPSIEAVTNELNPDFEVGGLVDSWGIEPGRSIHNVTLRNISGTGFDWYSYGDMYINWIGIGLLPEGEAYLPPELQGPIDELKTKVDDLKLQFDEELQRIRDYLAGIGVEPPPPVEPPPEEPYVPPPSGGGAEIFGILKRFRLKRE